VARPEGRSQTIAQLLATGLAATGVDWAFTVPGESFLPMLEALPKAGIRVVATRHEGGAAFMAEAVGQLTGRPAVCLGTRAVGAANLAIGIHTARQNSTPMVVVVGQVSRAFRGREAFQEVDLVATFGRLAKWAAELTDPATAVEQVGEGLRAMLSGRPGPVLFSVPEDVFGEWLPEAMVDVTPAHPAAPDAAQVEGVLRLLSEAERPAILAGGGVLRAGASEKLVALAEAMEVPVFAAWRRPDVFPNDHPLYLGMTGYGAAATVLHRLEEADALLVLGCRLSEVASFSYRLPAPATRWAHVDLEPRGQEAVATGLAAPDLALAADAAAFLEAVIGLASGLAGGVARGVATTPDRRSRNAADRDAYVAASTLDAGEDWSGPGVHPGRVVTTLQRVLPADAILTTDAGNFGLWPARGYRFTRRGTFLGPTSGAMGYGLPAAIAASLCRTNRTVVALCGDGGLAMTMAELETAVRQGAAPVCLVFDNRRYGTIAMHQQRAGQLITATGLGPIDFAAVARACGAQGGRINRDAEFEPALRDALAAQVPAVLQLEVDPRWVSPDVFDG
jgi:acetolactate synthase-1/2/3 large subunit